MAVKNTASGAVVAPVAPATAPATPVAPSKVTDKQASGQLKVLYGHYVAARRQRPKAPSEAVIMPLLFQGENGRAQIDALWSDTKAKTAAWEATMFNIGSSIRDLGQHNPGAPIAIRGKKSGRVVQKNGHELFTALMREEADVLNGEAL